MAMALLAAAPSFDPQAQAWATTWQVASEYDGLSRDIKENCVAFAKYKVPSLPSGLWTAADKQRIINTHTPKAGMIAIYSYNHVSYVEKVNGNQIVTLNGGFTDDRGVFTEHIERITGTAAELQITGYWAPANITVDPWWKSQAVQNIGDDFYAKIVLTCTGVPATVDPGTNNYIVNANTSAQDSATLWHFARNSDGSYAITNPSMGDRCFQAQSNVSGSRIALGSTWKGTDDQKWFVYHAAGKYIIRNGASDFVVNVDNAQSAAGAKWQIWTYTDSAAERLSIKKETPIAASTLTVNAGTSTSPTNFSWTVPSANSSARQRLFIEKLADDGVTYEAFVDVVFWPEDAATSYQRMLGQEGSYRAYLRTVPASEDILDPKSYTDSNVVNFEIKTVDDEAPTVSDVQVLSVSDTAVVYRFTAHDNSGISTQYNDNDKFLYYEKLPEASNGGILIDPSSTISRAEGLTDTPQNDVTVTVTVVPGSLVGTTLLPGHHEASIVVRDVYNNMGFAPIEFDIPYQESDIVRLKVGQTVQLSDILDEGSGVNKFMKSDQDVVELQPAVNLPTSFTGIKAGACDIVFYKYPDSTFAVRRFVVTEEGQEAPVVDATDQAAVDAATEAIWALPTAADVTTADADAIAAARSAFDALTDAQLDLIPTSTYRQLSAKLTAAEERLAELGQQAEEEAAKAEDQTKADAFTDAMAALPAPESLTLDDADAVFAAYELYDELTEEQIDLIDASTWTGSMTKLTACQDALTELSIRDFDERQASAVTAVIEALPHADDVTLDDKEAIEGARSAFDTLTDDQIDLISTSAYRSMSQKLEAAEQALAALEGGQEDPDPGTDPEPDPGTDKIDIATLSATLSPARPTYERGVSIEPKVSISGLVEGTDFITLYYNNHNAGTATVEILGRGRYTGTKTVSFAIAKANIAKAFPALAPAKTSVTYTGAAQKPGLKKGNLPETFEYSLSYAKNKEIGTATLTVTGKDNYTGKKVLSFTIVPGKAAFKSVKPAKKSVTVQAKAQKGGVSYQVRYRTGKGAWKTKTAKTGKLTIKKLKSGTTYQVQVRAFKKVGSKTYYGAWSAAKKAKAK